jgi:hypothetical protein
MTTMQIALIVVGVVAALLAVSRAYLFWDRRSVSARIAIPHSLAVRQIPSVVGQLRAAAHEASWAAFAFLPGDDTPSDENIVNLQYSIENGVVGLDWVLLAPRNKADKEKVLAFIRQHNHSAVEKERNGVQYFRVEDGDLAMLGIQIAAELYRLDRYGEMAIFTDKFKWSPE